MGDNMHHFIEKYEADFNKIASKDVWSKDDIAMMKDLQKLMYYMEVRCAMKDGEEYPGSEYMPEMSRGSGRGRDSMGRYTSGNMYYPPNYYMNDASGRRYYDDAKKDAIHKLHHMMENTDDEGRKSALKLAIQELEQK